MESSTSDQRSVPITYRVSPKGKQYVVIAAGGHAKIKEEPLGDSLVAFKLPSSVNTAIQ